MDMNTFACSLRGAFGAGGYKPYNEYGKLFKNQHSS